MDNIEKQEQKKYEKAWKNGAEGQSRTAWYVFNYLKTKLNKEWKILDLGCGNGMIVELLRQEGFNNVFGVDITLEGLKQYRPMIKFNQPVPSFVTNIKNYYQFPLWNLPFQDKEFDFTFSSDVLEHIPSELINQTISEISRITRIETFHCISTFYDKRKGFNFHLTIMPIDWWQQKFNNIKAEIVDRTYFLKKYIPDYTGL